MPRNSSLLTNRILLARVLQQPDRETLEAGPAQAGLMWLEVLLALVTEMLATADRTKPRITLLGRSSSRKLELCGVLITSYKIILS